MSVTNTANNGYSIWFDQEPGRYRAAFDPTTHSPSMIIVDVMSDILDIAATEMDQLFYSVDTDALDELLAPEKAGPVQVSFEFAGQSVTVSSEGWIAVDYPRGESTFDRGNE